MNIRHALQVMVLGALAVLWSGSSLAQCCYAPDISVGILDVGYDVGMLEVASDAYENSLSDQSGTRDRTVPEKISDSDLEALNFTPSDSVAQDMRARFLEKIEDVNPDSLPVARKLFNSGVLLDKFNELLPKFDYSPHNVADVMAAYLILSWETATGGDATRYPEGIEAVQRSVRYSSARNPKLVAMSDARKQSASNAMAIMAMMGVAGRDAMQQQGQRGQLAGFQEGIRQQAMKVTGLDVKTLRFGNTGFVVKH